MPKPLLIFVPENHGDFSYIKLVSQLIQASEEKKLKVEILSEFKSQVEKITEDKFNYPESRTGRPFSDLSLDDKLSYPDIDQFDVDEAKSCVSFYNKLKAEEENLMKKNKAEDAKMKSFATQHGYKDVFGGHGVMGAIALTQYGEMSLSEAKQYLIKKDDVAFDTTLIAEAVVDDMVVYTSRIDTSFRFALKKDAEGFYGKGSPLRGSYFAITGKTTLKTSRGSIEVITLKKVK